LAQRDGVWPSRPTLAAFGVAFVLTLLYFIPPPRALAPRREDLTVMSYNIHHGFDDAGVPGMQRTARQIAIWNPDVVALQEIGRGWTLLGGNDLISYLEWRFPEYTIHYAPTNGQLWGNAIMSRLPLLSRGGVTFDAPAGTFRYGYAHAEIEYGDTLLFMSVHLTADLQGPSGDARLMQANDVLHHALQITREGGRVLVGGDFNANPHDGPIGILRTSLTDLTAEAGLADIPTWPAARGTERIDYIFGQGFDVLGGMVPRIPTSDHLPVIVTLR
jgi:endonuclease/exonuclease/phosphatase family metal-dependent hydrolase